MTEASRFVIDTNVLVSAVLFPRSVPRRAFEKAIRNGALLMSEATMEEFADVLSRSKFEAYATVEERKGYVAYIAGLADFIPILRPIRACRDPRDDKFLEVAAHGEAALILTGDADLLALHPFSGVAILTPARFIEKV